MKSIKRVLVAGAVAAAGAGVAMAADPVYGSAEVDAAVASATALKTALITVGAGILAWVVGSRLIRKFIK